MVPPGRWSNGATLVIRATSSTSKGASAVANSRSKYDFFSRIGCGRSARLPFAELRNPGEDRKRQRRRAATEVISRLIVPDRKALLTPFRSVLIWLGRMGFEKGIFM